MLVSFEKSFLYVHVPKTGGTSMRGVLSRYEHANETYWTNRLLRLIGVRVNYHLGDFSHYRFRTHDPFTRAVDAYPPQVLDRLYKFAFVRNPWDLLASYRNFICDLPNHKRHRRVVGMCFREFISFAIAKRIGFQKTMLADRQGEIRLDFVGRFENLARDYAQVARRINVTPNLPHDNRGCGQDYREYYTRRTRRLVEMAYAEDIDTFQYEFDGSSAGAPLRRAA